MFTVLLWGLIGAGIGFLAFALAPPVMASVGGIEARRRIGQWYVSLAQTAIGDAAIVARKQGGLSLTSVSYDARFQADKASVDGETGHIADDLSAKSRLANKPFGICLESHPVYISPLIAEFADAMHNALDKDRLGLQPDGGMRLDLEVPEASQLPSLRDAHRFLSGNCRRRYGKLAESWTEKSQEGFHDRITLGETMLIIIAFAVGCAMAWFVLSYGPDSSGGGVTVPVGAITLASAAVIPAGEKRRRNLQMTGVVAAAVAAALALTVVVAIYWSIFAAIAFVTMAAGTAMLPWLTIRLLGSATPFGGIAARGLWILAQLSTRRGGLVRADTGHYEYQPLQSDDDGFFAELDNGDVVRIDGDDGDLYRFAWRPLAISEQKTERNLGPYTVTESEIGVEDENTRETRQGTDIHHPTRRKRGSWLLSAARLKNLARGSAGAELVRSGRDKALEEDGGTQQLNPMWTMVIASVMLVFGFVLSFLALGGL